MLKLSISREMILADPGELTVITKYLKGGRRKWENKKQKMAAWKDLTQDAGFDDGRRSYYPRSIDGKGKAAGPHLDPPEGCMQLW